MPIEQAPPQGQPPAAEGQPPAEGGGGSPEEAIVGIASTVNEGLQMLAEVFQKLGKPGAEEIAQLGQSFQEILSQAMGGGGGQPDQGMASQEAGGAQVIPADQRQS